MSDLTDADFAAMDGYHVYYFAPTWGAGEPATRVIPVSGIKLRKSTDITWTPAYEVTLNGVLAMGGTG